MQPENLTAIASAACDAPGLEQPEGEQPEIARLVGFDEALGDPPPHAANPSSRATRAASRGRPMPTRYIDHRPVWHRPIRAPPKAESLRERPNAAPVVSATATT